MKTEEDTGWPYDWQPKFLEAFAELGNVRAAAKAANISHVRAYQVRKEDRRFRKAWKDAQEAAVELVIGPEIYRRAVEGVEEPVFYGGKRVDTVRRYSDILLIFLAKSHGPEIYNRPVIQHHVGLNGEPIQREREELAKMTADELRAHYEQQIRSNGV